MNTLPTVSAMSLQADVTGRKTGSSLSPRVLALAALFTVSTEAVSKPVDGGQFDLSGGGDNQKPTRNVNALGHSRLDGWSVGRHRETRSWGNVQPAQSLPSAIRNPASDRGLSGQADGSNATSQGGSLTPRPAASSELGRISGSKSAVAGGAVCLVGLLILAAGSCAYRWPDEADGSMEGGQ